MLKATIINYFVEVGDFDAIKMISPSLHYSDFKDDNPIEIISQIKTVNKSVLYYILAVFDQFNPKI
jgi:hypothetical protein